MDVIGEDGTLSLEGGAMRGFQSGLLRLLLNGDPNAVENHELDSLPESVANVAAVYAALRDDIASDTEKAPSFGDAVRVAHLVDDLRASGESGATVTPSAEWPVSGSTL